jgi:MFS transporter, ACS family, hexuronate transporter
MRWWVVVLLLAATTINYIDRQTLSVLAPVLQSELHISTLEYSYAINAFLAVYAAMYFLAGKAVDRLGTRKGLGLALIWWSVAEMLHGLLTGIRTLCILRALLAVGEAAIIPSGVKGVAEWFGPKQRGVAVGTFEIGLSLGPMLAPPLVVWITLHQGWRLAFFWTGLLGLIWTVPWLLFYHVPAEIAPEGAQARDPRMRQETTRWSELFRCKQLWAVGLARFFGDPVWYFYLFWFPKYLSDSKGLNLSEIAAFAWIPYLAALLGGLCGGGASSWLVSRGVETVKARQRVLFLSSIMVSSGVLCVYLDRLLWVLVVVSAAAFAMQCWGANLDTLPSDLFPPRLVAQAVGACGLLGSVGGIVFTAATGYLVQHYSYTPVWVASAVTYPIGLLLLFLLLRRPSRVVIQP